MRTRQERGVNQAALRTRNSQTRFSYKEDSSDVDTTSSADEISSATSSLPRSAASKVTTISRSTRPGASSTIKRKADQSRSRPRSSSKKTKSTNDSQLADSLVGGIKQGTIHKWHTLPYEILLQIFQYASYPLRGDRHEPTPSVQWLLQTALLCKSFAEPALTALYYAPPLSPPSRATALIAHLSSQNESSTFDYRSKIKYLDFEATSTLLLKYAGQEPIDLAALVVLVPQLRGIGIHMLFDQPKYYNLFRLATRKSGKVYKKSMFDALKATRISLREWKWNFCFYHADPYPWSSLVDIHASQPFRLLEHLEIVNYSSAYKYLTESRIAAGINALSNLSRLTFRHSFFGHAPLLPLLPQNLASLCLSDCSAVTSEMLGPFLNTHGSHLRELTLDHNRSLNLTFLVDLAVACPKLQRLKMNLTFYNSSPVMAYIDLGFEELLPPDEVPTWPSDLQHIELLHLRRWQIKSAETLFQSLLDSATSLSHLRTLIVKASVQIGWRDRANFRERWIGQLRRTFLRHAPPPKRFEGLQDNRVEQIVEVKVDSAGSAQSDTSRQVSSRRSSLRKRPSRQSIHDELVKDFLSSETDSDAPMVSAVARRSKRLLEQDRDFTTAAEPEEARPATRARGRPRSRPVQDVEDSGKGSNDDGGKKEDSKDDIFVQGLCNVVDIRIDNLRPAEQQFDENDFLDEELSGDEDWNGEDVPLSDAVHAW